MRTRLACLALAACGAPPPAAPKPPARAPEVKVYAPLGMRSDAKAADRAIILGTDARDGSTVLPLPAAQARASVDALFVKLGTPPTGGLTKVALTTAPNPDQRAAVGVFEEMAGGAGPQWRAGVWVAAIVAATALDKDLTDFQFSASAGGTIDGASASGLMAAGLLATITGAPLDEHATLTGMIDPDGTIGPVAGIPEKFAAAIDHGKTKLGFPLGMRMAKSEATGQPVDLVELARKRGAEAVELADVHDAYRLMTGKQLPRAVAVDAAAMALDAATERKLDAWYADWQKHIAPTWAKLVQLQTAGRLSPLLSTIADHARHGAEAAEQLHKRHLAAAARIRALAAFTYAQASVDAYEVIAKLRAGDVTGARAALAEIGGRLATVGETIDRIASHKPATLGGHIAMLAGFEAAIESWIEANFAQRIIAATDEWLATLVGKSAAELGAPALVDQLSATLVPAMVFATHATVGAAAAAQQLELASPADVSYTCSVPNALRSASSLASASAAGMSYVDTLLVQPLAQQNKLSDADARQRLALVEPTYLVAFIAAELTNPEGVAKPLAQKWGEHSLAWGLFSLAAGELAYGGAAQLVAKYYAFGAHAGSDGRVASLDQPQAFAHVLAAAEQTARASGRAARIASGGIPVQAKLAYQLASVEREGDVAEQLDALAELWTATAISQAAVMLARN